MHILHCSCCGEEVTMPKWNDGKPYGYTCFARLFGKTKSSRYVPVKGYVKIIRKWDDHLDNMSPEGVKEMSGKYMISFSHPAIPTKKLMGVTDYGICYNDVWYVPDNAMKNFIKRAREKFIITLEQYSKLTNLL